MLFKRILLALFFLMLLFAEYLWAEELPLADLSVLEQKVGDNPETLAALAELARDRHLFNYQTQRATPLVFAGLSGGHYNEPIARTLPDTELYSNLRFHGGVSFPLLGTWSNQKINVLRAELQIIKSSHNSKLLKLRNLTALRKAYAVIWAEQRKEPILKAFLANEAFVDNLFMQRREQGYLLDADRLEFMSAFENCRRELALASYRKSQSLNVISLATGRKYKEAPILEAPSLPNINLSDINKNNAVELNPETHMRSETVRIYEEILQESSHLAREATFDVGAFYNAEIPGTPGSGIYAAILIREPFGSLKSRVNSSKMAASEDVELAKHEEDAANIRMEHSLKESISLRDYSAEAINFGIKRLEAGCEAIRMTDLRHQNLPGDTLEKLQQSRYDYLRTAINLIDAQLYHVQTCIDIVSVLYSQEYEPHERSNILENSEKIKLLFSNVWLDFNKTKPDLTENYVQFPLVDLTAATVKHTSQTATQDKAVIQELAVSQDKAAVQEQVVTGEINKDAAKPSPVKKSYGVYVWDAAVFLDETGAEINLTKIKELGFDRILISFNSAQINLFRTANGRKRLMSLLDKAKNLGITTELLLGDPTWALPQEREGLFTLLRFLGSFPFSGVHLDIEPDSLPNAENRRKELLKELFQTLNIAKKVTSHPIAISMHPRYFEEDLGNIAASLLEETDISEIALMIYSTNQDAVRKRFKDIALRFPNQRFTLAQSVERILSDNESWYKLSQDVFYRYMSGTYPSILVQAWEDYQNMRP